MQTSLTQRLTRSSQDRVLAGVAGGVARYFEVDSTVVRLVMVVLFFAGIGFIIYPVLWLVMPRDDRPAQPIQPGPGARFHPMTGEPLSQDQGASFPQAASVHNHSDWQRRFGVVLLGLGSFILADLFFPWVASLLFPLVLICTGLVLMSKHRSGGS